MHVWTRCAFAGSFGRMREASLEFLRNLVNTPSPTGQEARGQRVWLDYVRTWAEHISTDTYGNCVAVFNRGGSPRIMLAAHADEIALAIHFITDDGYLHVLARGGVDPAIMRAQRVRIHSSVKGIENVPGVIGNVPPHLARDESANGKPPRIHELFIDIGAKTRREALKWVQVGDLVTVAADFDLLHNDLAVARALDNRTGTFAVAETLRLLAETRKPIAAEVNVVSNVQEEVGLFGIRQIAYSLQPDAAVIVDVTHATDYPGLSKAQHGDIRLGSGPVLTHGGCNHPDLVRRLQSAAKAAKIPLQYRATGRGGGTDTDAIFWTRGGIPSALVSLPNRYMHSPVEVVSLKDMQLIPQLLAGFVRALKKDAAFKTVI